MNLNQSTLLLRWMYKKAFDLRDKVNIVHNFTITSKAFTIECNS